MGIGSFAGFEQRYARHISKYFRPERRGSVMRFKPVCVFVLLCVLWPAKASADNRFIVRTSCFKSFAILPY